MSVKFAPADENWKSVYEATKTLTAYVPGGFIENDGTNNVPADENTTRIKGIIDESKLVGDAGVQAIKVLVPRSPEAEFEGPVTAGTLAKANEGKELDLHTDGGIDAGNNTTKAVICTRFLAADRGRFKINYAN